MFASMFYHNVSHSHPLKVPLLFALFACFSAATVESYIMAQNTLSCLIYFCVNAPDLSPNTSSGANFIGMVYFFVCLFFSFVFLYLLVLTISWGWVSTSNVSADESDESSSLLPGKSDLSIAFTNKDFQTYRLARTGKLSQFRLALLVASVLALLYPLLIVSCTLLPTWWNMFQSAAIIYYQSTMPDQSLGSYWYIESGDVVMKLFPVRLVRAHSVFSSTFSRRLIFDISCIDQCLFRLFTDTTFDPFSSVYFAHLIADFGHSIRIL